MQEPLLIRSGDIAFVLAAAFIAGIAACALDWNIFLVVSVLFLCGVAALYSYHLQRFWPGFLIALLIFILAAAYYHFYVQIQRENFAPSQQWGKQSTPPAFPLTIFNAVLPSRQSELLGAIMTGSMSAVDPDLKSQMTASGTSYIIGMYGYKINLFAAAMLGAGKRFFSRRITATIIVLAIGAFIVFANAPIAAVRAGIMMGLVFAARESGRPFHTRNVFTFTVFIMLIFDPTLLGDIGFQLSFLSLLGIFVLGPPLNKYFHKTGHELFDWKSHAIMAVAVNTAIMPLVMVQFGDFSITSFVSNFLIAIPFAIVIELALVVVALGLIVPPLAFLAGAIINIFLSYQLWVIKFFATFVIPLPEIFRSECYIAFYYFILIAFVIYYENKENETEEAI